MMNDRGVPVASLHAKDASAFVGAKPWHAKSTPSQPRQPNAHGNPTASRLYYLDGG